jgi:hypothetical protein
MAVGEEQGANSPFLCIHGATKPASRCRRGHDLAFTTNDEQPGGGHQHF